MFTNRSVWNVLVFLTMWYETKQLASLQLLSESLKQQSLKLACLSFRSSVMPSKTTVRHLYGVNRTTDLQCVGNICGEHKFRIIAEWERKNRPKCAVQYWLITEWILKVKWPQYRNLRPYCHNSCKILKPWGPPKILDKGYRVFSGVKAAEACRRPFTPSSTEVEGKVELFPIWVFVAFSTVNVTCYLQYHLVSDSNTDHRLLLTFLRRGRHNSSTFVESVKEKSSRTGWVYGVLLVWSVNIHSR